MRLDSPSTCIELSKALIHGSRDLMAIARFRIAESAVLIAGSKLRLQMPIADGSDPPAASSMRAERTEAKAVSGTELWAGGGRGGLCDGCGEVISGVEQEYELVYSGTLTFKFHRECFVSWSNVSLPESSVQLR